MTPGALLAGVSCYWKFGKVENATAVPAVAVPMARKGREIQQFRQKLSQVEWNSTDDADFVRRRTSRAAGAGLVVAVAAESLNGSMAGRVDLAERGAAIGGELLRGRVPRTMPTIGGVNVLG
jgi:hypothetical protein